MEATCLSKGQQSSANIINTLPQSIIETILCLVPIEEAARTSILSRDWRYKWTTIPKLVFSKYTVSERRSEEKQTSDTKNARKNMDSKCKLLYAIQQILLLRRGPIHEFTLHMEADHHCIEIDQIILHLSMNHTIKKLTLEFCDKYYYKLPLCAFSMHQLTDLRLLYIDLEHQPTFIGFASLRSLHLHNVNISTEALLHLLSHCPSLTSFHLFTGTEIINSKDCTILELFECLPMIEHLTTYGCCVTPLIVQDSFPKEFSTSLIHLKYFCLEEMWFEYEELCSLVVLIKCSPNLAKIRIENSTSEEEYDDEYDTCSSILKEYSDVRLEHLTELEIECFSNSKLQREFVKFILARSPKLKKLWISCFEWHQDDTHSGILEECSDVRLEHLTELEIESFSNSKLQMEFLKFILARSPNLKKLWISCRFETYQDDTRSGILEEYSDVRLDHLTELKIKSVRNSKLQMEFVKFILARSPKLKKVWISVTISPWVRMRQEELEIVETLLQAPHGSMVEIVVV